MIEELSAWIWFGIGIILILLEFTAIPGIGFLFVGFGALTTSLFLYIFPLLLPYQLGVVGIISFGWFIILWRPIKKFLYSHPIHHSEHLSKDYFTMVGAKVVVINKDIKSGQMGEVLWSGTTMNAQLINAEIANINDVLIVKEVKGNVLICAKE